MNDQNYLVLSINNSDHNVTTVLPLPFEPDEFEVAMSELKLDDEKDLEIIDISSELDNLTIDFFKNIDEINEFFMNFDNLNNNEKNDFMALYEVADDPNKAMNIFLNRDYCFYPNWDMSDCARQLVIDGCFGYIPENIRNYIDYDKIANDLSYDNYYKTKYGVLWCDCV